MSLILNILTFFTAFYAEPENYPVPEKSSRHLFYIQRMVNSNTVVYEANFDEEGFLDTQRPVHVFWVDFEDGAKISELNLLEKRFAYGVKFKALNSTGSVFELKLAAYDKISLRLKWICPFKAAVFMPSGDSELPVDHAFISSDNNGFFTRVESIKVFLREPGSGALIEKEVYKN
jgi:hypothetical protein